MVHLLYFHLFSEKLVLIFLIKYVLTQIKMVHSRFYYESLELICIKTFLGVI